METPCIDDCEMDGASGLCLGCGRSIDEIADAVQIAPRSVKRKLSLIRDTWAKEVQA